MEILTSSREYQETRKIRTCLLGQVFNTYGLFLPKELVRVILSYSGKDVQKKIPIYLEHRVITKGSRRYKNNGRSGSKAPTRLKRFHRFQPR